MSNSAVREGAKTTLLVIVAFIALLAVISGVVIGGWEAGWWFRQQDTTRTTDMIRHSVSAQNSYVDDVENSLTQLKALGVQLDDPNLDPAQKPGLEGEKTAIINQTCIVARKIDPSEMQPDIAQFLATDCTVTP